MEGYTEAYINGLDDGAFTELTGVTKPQFAELLDLLQTERQESHKKGGRPFTISVFDCLMITLLYMRQYMTMFVIGTMYGINKSTVMRIYNRTLDTVIRSGYCRLEGRRAARDGDLELIDATECPINRPKHGQKRKYSGKKNTTRTRPRSSTT